MITSPQNEKLKLVRRLHERRHREREGLFLTEGEDLLEAGHLAGQRPEVLLTAAGSGLGGVEVQPKLLDEVSTLGSGTRAIAAWPISYGEVTGPVCVYLHGIGDPGNVGAIVRTAHALVDGTIVIGPGCADPHGPKAVRATMGSIFAQRLVQATIAETPRPRVALVAHGGEPLQALAGLGAGTICFGAEREGLPIEVADACDTTVTIPIRDRGPESLNVAAAAAIALQWISSPASVEVGDG